MTEFEVTGITYQIGRGLPREEAKAAANKFIMSLKAGTPLILVAEPNNAHDENAIAVYINYTQHIGYIKSTSCLEVKPLLDEDGQCNALVSGNDGNITMFITIPDVQDPPITTRTHKRVLPANPLPEVLCMDYTEQEKALQVVAPRLSKMKPTVENIPTLLTMVQSYMPLASLSLCYEDYYWRDHILRNLRSACKLNLEPELKQKLTEIRNKLSDIEGDMTRSVDHPKFKLMERQLEQLRTLAQSNDGLIAKFDKHIATSGSTVKEELKKLTDWFKSMPRLMLRDYQNHEKLAECLGYQHVSRKELYEVYAAIIIIEMYTRVSDESTDDFNDILEYTGRVKGMLAASWTTERYDALWDAILSIPAVKWQAKKVGKQQNTTFNRNLIANILHTMIDKHVFAPSASNQTICEALEGTKDHSVRSALGTALKDKALKTDIERLIEEMNR
ncbi:HIRAN domain-containing protein [Xylanibacter ruminicola]|uniref:HIRAN domain-containing protein n=1 Tax=Xylanibacter ruminicola TaxID=839 RepID=A0A1M6TV44_XYLRU|nr:HIRAN domain-containing protein [Xylanibacter ruminicola]SHK60763.1 HIRAN domain-containing protein [Xylanibacter ruminicola]